MEVLRVEESREPCAESGWYAYDLALSRPVMRKDILSLKEHGDLTYLAQLKMPFYKLNQPYFYLQGMEGEAQLRLAVYREVEERTLQEVTEWIQKWEE